MHRRSGTLLLPGFRSRTVYTNRRLDPAERQNIFCEILEHNVTHRPVFQIRSEGQMPPIVMTSGSATKAVADFTAKLLGAPLRKKSGPEFFGYSRLEVQRMLILALQNSSDRQAQENAVNRVADDLPDDFGLTDSYSCRSHGVLSFRLVYAGEVVSEELLSPHELDLWRFRREDELYQWRKNFCVERLICESSGNRAVVRCTISACEDKCGSERGPLFSCHWRSETQQEFTNFVQVCTFSVLN